jgi:hypothetical protein
MSELHVCEDFQRAMNSHRHYLSTITRLCWMDQTAVQTCLQGVLHICWRFIAVVQILDSNSIHASTTNVNNASSASKPLYRLPPILPEQEIEAIQKDFSLQLHYLLHMLRATDTRGLLLRLDFNSFLSEYSTNIRTSTVRSSA